MKRQLSLLTTLALALMLTLEMCQSANSYPLTEAEKTQYLEDGKKVAVLAQSALSKQLLNSLDDYGVPYTLDFCKSVALPLLDTLSSSYKCTIRRTSLKVRNPQDAPTKAEKAMLEAFAKQDESDAEIEPVVQALNAEEVAFYTPIRLQAACLGCHGQEGTDIHPTHVGLIKKLYPDDQATGYKLGDLRGMWSITYKRN
jgi:hypothetical protein